MRICWSGFSKTNKGSESVLTTILTIYRSGLRGNYGLCGTKKHGFRTKKHEKARKMRQKTDAFAFGTSMPQVRILSLRPYRVFITDVRNTRYFFACIYLIFDCLEQIRLLFFILWLYCAWEIFDSHSLP